MAKSISIETARFIPSVLEMFNSPKAVSALFVMLDDQELSIRIEAVRSLNKMRLAFPNLNMRKRDVINKINEESNIYLQTLSAMHTQVLLGFHTKKPLEVNADKSVVDARKSLMTLLESRLESHLERIFGLLGLRYPPEEMSQAFEAIQSEHQDKRLNAIEFLDNLLESDLKRILIPIVEVSIVDTVNENVLRNLNLKVMGEFECFSMILNGNDTRLKLAVIYLIGQLKEKKYVPQLMKLSEHNTQKISDFAKDSLNKIQGN
jgi:AAA family ATP:ADP antiporter